MVPQRSPLSWIKNAEMCGITLTGGTWTLWLPARWWGHWSQWECLWNACSITAEWRQGTAGQGGGTKGRNGTCSKGRLDDRLMWGCKGGGCPVPVSSEPKAIGGEQNVFTLWRGLSFLLKKLDKVGYTARKISQNGGECSRLTKLSVFH